MSILDFGYEGAYRKAPVWYPKWLRRLPRPVNPMARLHFLVALRRFRHLLPLGKSGCVLEAGSGRGYLSFWFARSFPNHVVGVDLDEGLIAENQQLVERLGLQNLRFFQRDLAQPLDLAQRFDLVLCFHVLEHIEDDVGALEHLYDVMAPGGHLVVLVPGGLEPLTASNLDKLKTLGHVRPGYSLAELRNKVMAAGLQVMSDEVALGLWGILACKSHFNLIENTRSFLFKGIGWALASIFVFLEYWFPIRLEREVLLVACKENQSFSASEEGQ